MAEGASGGCSEVCLSQKLEIDDRSGSSDSTGDCCFIRWAEPMRSLLKGLSFLLRLKSGAAVGSTQNSPARGREPSEGTAQSSCPYVYVEDDGTARELEPDEVEYLNTKFEFGDGNRPYIKSSYEQLTPDNRMRGYLRRMYLPAGVHVKTLAELTPVDTAETAIGIAKMGIPMSFCIKSGTSLRRVTDPRTGKGDFGVPGVDPRSGTFKATLTSGVWHVVRTPDPSADAIEAPCYADISAASGRIRRFFWL